MVRYARHGFFGRNDPGTARCRNLDQRYGSLRRFGEYDHRPDVERIFWRSVLSYGSYNTNKQSLQIGSGLMGGHWTVDARLSHISSDGYVDRAFTNLESYMLQVGYYDGGTAVKLISFGGVARVGLAYDGVTKEQLETDRRYNSQGLSNMPTDRFRFMITRRITIPRSTIS